MHGYGYGYKNDYNLRIPTRGLDTFRVPVDDDDDEAGFPLPFELDGAAAGVADVDDEIEADGTKADGEGLL